MSGVTEKNSIRPPPCCSAQWRCHNCACTIHCATWIGTRCLFVGSLKTSRMLVVRPGGLGCDQQRPASKERSRCSRCSLGIIGDGGYACLSRNRHAVSAEAFTRVRKKARLTEQP